jgi:hypothetical protein
MSKATRIMLQPPRPRPSDRLIRRLETEVLRRTSGSTWRPKLDASGYRQALPRPAHPHGELGTATGPGRTARGWRPGRAASLWINALDRGGDLTAFKAFWCLTPPTSARSRWGRSASPWALLSGRLVPDYLRQRTPARRACRRARIAVLTYPSGSSAASVIRIGLVLWSCLGASPPRVCSWKSSRAPNSMQPSCSACARTPLNLRHTE